MGNNPYARDRAAELCPGGVGLAGFQVPFRVLRELRLGVGVESRCWGWDQHRGVSQPGWGVSGERGRWLGAPPAVAS